MNFGEHSSTHQSIPECSKFPHVWPRRGALETHCSPREAVLDGGSGRGCGGPDGLGPNPGAFPHRLCSWARGFIALCP